MSQKLIICICTSLMPILFFSIIREIIVFFIYVYITRLHLLFDAVSNCIEVCYILHFVIYVLVLFFETDKCIYS